MDSPISAEARFDSVQCWFESRSAAHFKEVVMFWFCVLLTIITYPLVCVGSFLLGILIVILSSGPDSAPNPFVSPAKVYTVYRSSFEKWASELKDWYKRESK